MLTESRLPETKQHARSAGFCPRIDDMRAIFSLTAVFWHRRRTSFWIEIGPLHYHAPQCSMACNKPPRRHKYLLAESPRQLIARDLSMCVVIT
jgi:hypothetical protein